MSNQIFVCIGNGRIINLAHIIKARFSPAVPGGDDDGEGQPYGPVDASLTITTTETAAHEYGENGYIDAIVSDSVTFAVYGDYAETAWEVIQSFVMGRRE